MEKAVHASVATSHRPTSPQLQPNARVAAAPAFGAHASAVTLLASPFHSSLAGVLAGAVGSHRLMSFSPQPIAIKGGSCASAARLQM